MRCCWVSCLAIVLCFFFFLFLACVLAIIFVMGCVSLRFLLTSLCFGVPCGVGTVFSCSDWVTVVTCCGVSSSSALSFGASSNGSDTCCSGADGSAVCGSCCRVCLISGNNFIMSLPPNISTFSVPILSTPIIKAFKFLTLFPYLIVIL